MNQLGWLVGWLVVLRINVDLAIFQPYLGLEAGDNKSLKFKWRGRESNPGPLAPQAKSLTTRPKKGDRILVRTSFAFQRILLGLCSELCFGMFGL